MGESRNLEGLLVNFLLVWDIEILNLTKVKVV